MKRPSVTEEPDAVGTAPSGSVHGTAVHRVTVMGYSCPEIERVWMIDAGSKGRTTS